MLLRKLADSAAVTSLLIGPECAQSAVQPKAGFGPNQQEVYENMIVSFSFSSQSGSEEHMFPASLVWPDLWEKKKKETILSLSYSTSQSTPPAEQLRWLWEVERETKKIDIVEVGITRAA